MTYQEALNYIHSICWRGSRPGLSRTVELLEKLGNPQDQLKFIHVAGTNGKGSFCAMLSSVLVKAGYRTGTYTSPYILRFNERMKVNNEDIPNQTLARLTEKVRPIADAMADPPTEFELITAIAMLYFLESKCEIVVLECGMGGRLDSTNVIQSAVLSVITGIALDHTAFLGNSIAEIAREKAGIIKKNTPVLFCGKDPNAERVIREKAREMNAPYHTVDRSHFRVLNADLKGTTFTMTGVKDFFIPLLGSYQPENACNVLQAIELLNRSGYSLSQENTKNGLASVRWPARYEIVSQKPLIICDGGHNPEGVEGAVASTKLYFREKLLLITGVMADKDYRYMASCMSEIAKEVFCITPNNPRALKSEEFAQVFRENGVMARGYSTPKEALNAAMETAVKENRAILCLGSLYMYGEMIEALNEIRGK